MSDKPFNKQAAFLIEDAMDLIKQVLVKHSAAVLEEMRDQIVERNKKIAWYESAVCANIPHAIGPDVTGKAIDYVKVADLIRERDVLLAEVTRVKNDFDEAIEQRDRAFRDAKRYRWLRADARLGRWMVMQWRPNLGKYERVKEEKIDDYIDADLRVYAP